MNPTQIRYGQFVIVKPSRILGRNEPLSARVVERRGEKFFAVVYADGTRETVAADDMDAQS